MYKPSASRHNFSQLRSPTGFIVKKTTTQPTPQRALPYSKSGQLLEERKPPKPDEDLLNMLKLTPPALQSTPHSLQKESPGSDRLRIAELEAQLGHLTLRLKRLERSYKQLLHRQLEHSDLDFTKSADSAPAELVTDRLDRLERLCQEILKAVRR